MAASSSIMAAKNTNESEKGTKIMYVFSLKRPIMVSNHVRIITITSSRQIKYHILVLINILHVGDIIVTYG